MASGESTPGVVADLNITTLPIELQLEFVSHLTFLEKQLLRSTNKHFRNLISSPTLADLINAELYEQDVKERGLLYCNPCHRLLSPDKFSVKMRRTNRKRNKGGVATRFCIECGCRPLTGTADDELRYKRSCRWEHDGIFYVRCARCLQCGEAPSTADTDKNTLEHTVCLKCLPIQKWIWAADEERRRLQAKEMERQREEWKKKLKEENEARAANEEEPVWPPHVRIRSISSAERQVRRSDAAAERADSLLGHAASEMRRE